MEGDVLNDFNAKLNEFHDRHARQPTKEQSKQANRIVEEMKVRTI